jgi:hypothetical protein
LVAIPFDFQIIVDKKHLVKMKMNIKIILILLLSVFMQGCHYGFEITGARADYSEVKRRWEYCETCLKQEDCFNRAECEKNTPEKIKSSMGDALGRGKFDTVRYLIEVVGLDVDAPLDRYQDTALHESAYYGGPQDFEIVRYLVSKGANVNAIGTSHARTPLLTAIWKKNNEIARYLLSHGADTSIRSDRGYSVCVFAHRWSNWEIMPDLPGCCAFFLDPSWIGNPEESRVRPVELLKACKRSHNK